MFIYFRASSEIRYSKVVVSIVWNIPQKKPHNPCRGPSERQWGFIRIVKKKRRRAWTPGRLSEVATRGSRLSFLSSFFVFVFLRFSFFSCIFCFYVFLFLFYLFLFSKRKRKIKRKRKRKRKFFSFFSFLTKNRLKRYQKEHPAP